MLHSVEGGDHAASSAPKRTRRETTRAACDACRQHKVKCDAVRPRCRTCVRKGLPCSYDTRPSETQGQADKRRAALCDFLLKHLREVPLSDAQDMLNRIRSGEDADGLISTIEAGQSMMSLSASPERRFREAFPILPSMPAFLQQDRNPYIHSYVYEYDLAMGPNTAISSHAKRIRDAQEHSAPYIAPYRSAALADPLLANIIEGYLVHDHPMMGCFHIDLFLRDMVAGREQFCSRLLVHAILASGCKYSRNVTRKLEFWNRGTLVYQFTAEAKRLLEREIGEDMLKITTVQALIIIAADTSRSGLDKVGMSYWAQANVLAKRMGLMDPFDDPPDSDMRKAKLITAWSAYYFSGMVGFALMNEPLLIEPPAEAPPSFEEADRWIGEVYVKYPTDDGRRAVHHGLKWVVWCRLFHVASRIAHFRARHSDLADAKAKLFANEQYEALRQIYRELPEPLKDDKIVMPVHFHVQLLETDSPLTLVSMWYHLFVISLFEPFAGSSCDLDVFMVEAKPDHSRPSYIVSYSQACLETLIRVYYLRHGFSNMDSLLLPMLNFIASASLSRLNATIDRTRHDEILSTLVLCAHGIQAQGKHLALSLMVYRMLARNIRPEYRHHLNGPDPKEETEYSDAELAGHMCSQYPVRLIGTGNDPTVLRIDQLTIDDTVPMDDSAEASTPGGA